MSRIARRFEALRAAGRKALIPYVTAGDPNPDNTVPLMHAMVAAGADIIELGVPFSDPMADGPVIQQACERALRHHVSLRQVIGMVKTFREQDAETPVVLMGYLNPVEIMGYEAFAIAAASAGVDGLLTVDLPPEESHDLVQVLRSHGVDPIFLLAPTSHEARIKRICDAASGFVYYVSLKGVTGAATLDVDAVAEKLAAIRAHTDLPLGVGFGIRDADSAARVSRVADAVVVGSALVNRIAEHEQDPEAGRRVVSELLAEMRKAMD
ncbi:tryptophan synthase subunit alpha [Thioalkalivibrio sulfidiphilus]|uniref:Tryptophan synthase alpha chain n=1 Tax=Thioalkalivibrio sulfidiphilus (strain HL-EbGR7) TaxID=396588 RepID=TRPA_THISH|nr:tryptophan synthase subunit alpha [Thioalkalivibrio sulfidiphilus]B8GQE5.1 RecName: Full=Tryptophan synthase alpha chain [Thioalkalivibrio sulfidiphilus HL-EbGr7]ACL72340.1 tryptophan synthase, alpha subunit [Thioalkalivibrio sulfidiphilus HL-EbGr7]